LNWWFVIAVAIFIVVIDRIEPFKSHLVLAIFAALVWCGCLRFMQGQVIKRNSDPRWVNE